MCAHAVARVASRVEAACQQGQERPWASQLRAGLHALLTFLDDEPELARLVVACMRALGARVDTQRGVLLKQLVGVLDAGRQQSRLDPAALTSELLVLGTLGVLRYLREPDGPPLVSRLNELTAMLVGPFLGAARANRELSRSTPRVVGRASEGRTITTVARTNMRLTYRTVVVLRAIDANPGLSNKEVAGASGVRDQGQISKLLARLQDTDLVINTGDRALKGEANAWSLVAAGERLMQTAPFGPFRPELGQ